MAAVTGLIPAVAFAASDHPGLSRWLFAASLLGLFIVLARRWPAAAATAALCALPFLAGFRRLLITAAPWTSYDPLVLVGPAAAAILLARTVGGRTTARRGQEHVTLAVVLLVGIAILEAANPAGGGLKAGAAGLVFVVGPLLWYFVGRELGDRATLERVMLGALGVAVVVAVYGLSQTQLGFPSWDHDWLDWVRQSQGSLQSLQVANAIRPFASFSSFAEYSTFLSLGVIVSVALALVGRREALLALPILLPALFLASARGPLVLAVLGALILVVLAVRQLGTAVLVVVATLGVIAIGVSAASGAGGGNGLVSHQLGGLSNPFSAQSSTLGVHVAVIEAGLRAGFTNPVGSGTAATNLAGQKLGGAADFTATRAAFAQTNGLNAGQGGTEFDISNAFVGLGLPGGLIYLFIVVATVRQCWRQARMRRDLGSLATFGLLVVMFGQWLNGGFYALAPLLWFAVGAAFRDGMALSTVRARAGLPAGRRPVQA